MTTVLTLDCSLLFSVAIMFMTARCARVDYSFAWWQPLRLTVEQADFLQGKIRWTEELGRHFLGKIVGGTDAREGQFPFQAYVLIQNNKASSYLCGGVIVAPQWILTAAHCAQVGLTFTITLGAFRLTDVEPEVTRMFTTERHIHPKYNAVTLSHDVALIKLPHSLNFTDNIQKIRLVRKSQMNSTFLDAQATASGWGITSACKVFNVQYRPSIYLRQNVVPFWVYLV